MAKVFISYRRSDTAAISGRIYDRLVARLGKQNVFKDVDDIPPGAQFGSYIEDSLRQCAVMLVVIGSQWLDVKAPDGSRRLEDREDWVRAEVEHAFSSGLVVIPVLIEDTPMPQAADLPESIRRLTAVQALHVHYDPDFNHDMERAIAALSRYLPDVPPHAEALARQSSFPTPSLSNPVTRFVLAGVALALVVTSIGLIYSHLSVGRTSGTGEATATATATTATATRPSGSQTVYTENWGQGFVGWSPDANTTSWSASGGILTNNGTSCCLLIAPYTSSTPDYSVEAHIRMDSCAPGGGSFGLFGRGTPATTAAGGYAGYVAYWGSQEDLRIRGASDRDYMNNWSYIGNQYNFQLDTATHLFRLTFQGDSVSFYLDGTLYLHVTSSAFQSGGNVGIEDLDCTIHVSDFSVTQP